MKKVVITTVPFVDDDAPLAAPAVLKAVLSAEGIECVGLDLNIDIYNKIQNDPRREKFLDFFYNQKIQDDIVDDLLYMLDYYSTEILSYNPNIIVLSLFCYQCQTFTAWLCAVLRQTAPHVKIVIGGPGLETLENNFFKYPDRLKNLGLIDDYITGDGEKSLVQYVLGNKSFPGINSTSWIPNVDFENSPIPDYSNYRFFKYGNVLLPIVDSRGCVQDCEFCDVVAFWKRFQYKSAESIFSNMMYYVENYGILRFQFASSICNGNLKEFKKLVELIANYNSIKIEADQLHWIGSFIIRPKNYHNELLWEKIKQSNGFLLTGVESVTERVRVALGKKFSNEDLDYHLAMAKKYDVKMNLLVIASYHTETADDHDKAKKWFIDRKEYAKIINHVQLTTISVLPGTKLESTVDYDQFVKTMDYRLQKAKELNEVIIQCGFQTKILF